MNGDLISRSALLEELSSLTITITGLREGKGVLREVLTEYRKTILRTVDEAPAVDAVEVDAVAQMLYESFGDPHACNFNGNDEWLPMLCDNMNECPDVPDKLFCWKQFIKHYGERRADEC